MDVTAALYSHGTLLLAESSGPDAKATKLLLAARNYTLPPPSVNVNTASQSIWLREVVSDLSQLVPGKGCVCDSVRLLHGDTPTALAAQPPAEYTCVSGAALVTVFAIAPWCAMRACMQVRPRPSAACRSPASWALTCTLEGVGVRCRTSC